MKISTHHQTHPGMILLALFIFIIGFCSPPLIAQEEQEEEKQPEPIPTADIFQETENVASILDKSLDLLLPNESIEAISDGLPKYFKTLDQLHDEIDLKKMDKFGTSKLTDLQQSWKLHQEKLQFWQDKLAKRSNALEAERIKLLEMKKVWEVTLKNAKAEKAPPEVLDRISKLMTRLNGTEAKIRKRFGHIIAIQNRISIKISDIAKAITLIEERISERKAEAFTIDSKPLWKVFDGEEDEKSLSKIVSESFEAHLTTFREFFLNLDDA